MRGGEAVLEELCRMFPAADVYTHACIPGRISAAIMSHSIRESLVGRLPMGRTHCQKYLPLMPLAQRQWNFDGCDLIISSESGPVKGIRKPENCRHICYCHTPMRYVWDMHEAYYANAGICGKFAMRIFKNYLRRYDLKSTVTFSPPITRVSRSLCWLSAFSALSTGYPILNNRWRCSIKPEG